LYFLASNTTLAFGLRKHQSWAIALFENERLLFFALKKEQFAHFCSFALFERAIEGLKEPSLY